jgi:hypothetical protein
MTTKKKASEMLKEPHATPAMVLAMVELGRIEDDCGLRQNTAQQTADSRPLAKVIQLPVWPEAVRGVPNGVLRSALFGAIRKGPRRYLKRERIASLEGVDILYTGERLDQGDLDVWQAVLHIARLQDMGEQCRFTAYAMLKMLGKANTGQNREILHTRLTRLRANAVEIRQGRFTYIGGLVDEAYKDEETLEYVVVLNPKLRALFERDQWTATDWAVRLELTGHPLAQWLHGFYATHAQPYPISAEKLHELCGSENQSLRGFKQELAGAFESLTYACEKHGQAFKAEIRGNLVHTDRQPSRSQQNHLDKKAKKPKPVGQRRKAMTSVGDLLKPKN